MMYETGVYRWRNLLNDKYYIGGSYSSFVKRELWHRRALHSGYHFNKRLLRAWNKYGEESFVFEILERCPLKQVAKMEQKWLDRFFSDQKCYNLSPFSSQPPSALGKKRSEATKKKLSKALLGNTNSKGFKHSKDVRMKMSEAARKRMSNPKILGESVKRLHTPQVHKKIVEANRKRMTNPIFREEAANRLREIVRRKDVRNKLSKAAKNQWKDPESRINKLIGMKKAGLNPSCRLNRSRSAKARFENPIYKLKILTYLQSPKKRAEVSIALTGRPVSIETRAKISASVKAQWERRRC